MKMIHMNVPGHPEATLEGYILDCELLLGQNKARPAVVICPGGGYVYCSPREAEPVALAYANHGFHAFILRYSVGWDAAGFAPLQEVDWVIGYLRDPRTAIEGYRRWRYFGWKEGIPVARTRKFRVRGRVLFERKQSCPRLQS